MKDQVGFKDDSIEKVADDLFDIKRYITGLASFIRECDTPMTIAIQGDWGSGKTSTMNMIRDCLGKDVISIGFNTWTFSQFDMEDNLAISLLTYLSNELVGQKGAEITKGFKDKVEFLKRVSVKAFGQITEKYLGTSALNDELNDYLSKDKVSIIRDLKEDFQITVNSISEKNGGKRLVFFIDDLDRLQPIRAVELLEVLKIFLDCENCVFVLAIDYEVVTQGIKEKYNGTLDDKKSRKFFEKIIQVPFKMPVAHYNIDKYISEILHKVGVENENYVKYYISLIRTSIGYNPRAMKRTFNAYSLLTKIHTGTENGGMKEEYKKLLLFACLCLQLNYEDIYNYIVEHIEEDPNDDQKFVVDENVYQAILDNGISEESCGSELYNMIKDSKEYELEDAQTFLQSFVEAIKCDNDSITSESMDGFKEVLLMTSITSTGNIVKGNDIKGRGSRRDKEYDKKFTVHTIDAVKKKQIKTFVSAKVQWYSIAGERTVCENDKINFANFLLEAMDYAYKSDPHKFDEIRNRALEENPGMFSSIFCREKTKRQNIYKVMKEAGYELSTYSSNDAKAEQIRAIYTEMGLDPAIVKLSMKEAHNKS